MGHSYAIEFPKDTREDCERIFRFLMPMYAEVGRVRGNPDACMREIWRVCHEEFCFNVLRDGEIVGSAGIIKGEAWYTESGEVLTDRWLYTMPEVRETDPEVARLMFAEISNLVAATGLLALITVFNKKRFVRGRGTIWGQVGEKFAINPAGAVVAIQPGG